MAFVQNQIEKISAQAAANPRLRYAQEIIWPQIEKFLIAGPVFVGYILGFYKYPPRHIAFEIAFQSFVIFSFYLTGVVAIEILDGLFFSVWPLVLGSVRSLLALFYIALTFKQYFEWRKGDPHIYGITKRLRTRLANALGEKV
ncbi:MAG: hypothetical protein JSR44_04725 [Spirochaetes bacterium]|nr:hypothetical protein [Spirochaetota bacterium]